MQAPCCTPVLWLLCGGETSKTSSNTGTFGLFSAVKIAVAIMDIAGALVDTVKRAPVPALVAALAFAGQAAASVGAVMSTVFSYANTAAFAGSQVITSR